MRERERMAKREAHREAINEYFGRCHKEESLSEEHMHCFS